MSEAPDKAAGQPAFRCGHVAVLGRPNVGKSTLVNALVGMVVSVAAPRPQTTRQRILGILTGPDHQALFVDTPGLLEPSYELQRFMRREIEAALPDADLRLLVFDAAGDDGEDQSVLRFCGAGAVVALNKIDLVPDIGTVAERLDRFRQTPGVRAVHAVSAIRGDGVPALREEIGRLLPPGPPLYPPDQTTDRTERFLVAELVRAAVFRLYGAEIPYATTTSCEEFVERPGRKDYIRVAIIVERESQKPIIIGRDGRALKRLGVEARRDVEQLLGRPVYLELVVKVAENWRRDPEFIRRQVISRGGS